ncbi:SH3 domain-containing protein [Venturia nashicola]|uniref:SH3 domain-containing protein n=1 Tax=Venturia nashicola TaxID=86259 RepID=A0A4Z1PFP7_9PEZI|nr:SH3 domain-containing protein [Venturia nashicola]
MASNCISLRGSTACPAFNASSISTSATTVGFFPFLRYVSNTATFDTQFQLYISTEYATQKYQNLLGCSRVNLTDTTDLYARYTSTVLCNSIVQNSLQACSLTGNAARPVCAETCATFATSEESIAASSLCGTPSNNALSQIRADFTTCALPNDSLGPNCISGVQNEPNNCGFSSNLPSLCSYCAASSPNSTDSCCVNSRTESRCSNVRLPTATSSLGNLFPSSTSRSTSTPQGGTAGGSKKGLSGGALAGIIVGSILGAILLSALVIGCCVFLRRKKNSQAGSMLNQPSPLRQGPVAAPMSYASSTRNVPPDILPAGARVHHMAALEGSSREEHSSPIGPGGYVHSSSGYGDSPDSGRSRGLVAGVLPKRQASLSDNESSPKTRGSFSSPDGMNSGHSEQMSHFKDYYSQDDVRPGDLVTTLWAYQPRANDEWELDRGDMLKVVGIWDDGWATGVKLRERAEDWEARRSSNRDSGVSNGSSRAVMAGSNAESTESNGEIKAFPLVCVCLPQHWRKTIEGDTLDPSGSGGPPPSGSP